MGRLRSVTKGKTKYFFPLPMPGGAGAVARPVSGGTEGRRLKAARTCHPPRALGDGQGCCPGGPHRSSTPRRALSMSPGGTRVVPSS